MVESSPRKGWVLTQESFDELLAWLNPDREQAAEKYEDIRKRLIRIFIHRGCTTAEELADKTINLVTRKVREIKDTYVGDPSLYFYGVARNVYNDYRRQHPEAASVVLETLPAAAPPELDGLEMEYECLDKCLAKLPPQNREMVLEYYLEQERAKIKRHKEMAERLGVAINALRIRMHRLRAGLKKCVSECLKARAS